MYEILHEFFEDKTGNIEFSCFSIWHLAYLFMAIALMFILYFTFRKKEEGAKEKLLRVLATIPFALYMADFFLMPFAYGEIVVDKLPFHACTTMSIFCFASNNSKVLRKYRINFALLGLISNLIYIVYPNGVAGDISPICYRVIQTMLFHSIMVTYCVLTIIFDEDGLNIKKSYRDVIILCVLSVWALIGNTLYSGTAGNYNEDFNWFFVKSDPLGIFSEEIAPYIMPWLNVIVFFSLELIVYLLYYGIKHHNEFKKQHS